MDGRPRVRRLDREPCLLRRVAVPNMELGKASHFMARVRVTVIVNVNVNVNVIA